MAKRQVIQLPFPLKGLDENWAFNKQPDGTTPDALNVRPYDVLEGRLRGGQRPGHGKYFTSAVNGANPIQAIDQVTRAFDPAALDTDTLLFSDDFTYTDGILPVTHWYLFDTNQWGSPPTCAVDLASTVNGPVVKGNAIDGRDWAANNTVIGMVKDTITPGSNYVVRWTGKNNTANAGGTKLLSMFAVIRAGDPSTPPISANDYGLAGISVCSADTAGNAIIKMGADTITSVDLNTDLGWADDMWASSHTVEVRVVGNLISVWIDNVKVVEKSTAALSGNTGIGFGVSQWTASTDWWLDDFEIYTGVIPVSARTTTLVAVSGGRTYGADAGGTLSEVITEAVDFIASGRVATQEAFQNLYACDGLGANYHVYNPATHAVSGWVATDGVLPVETIAGTTAYTIDGVNQGTKTFTISGDGDLTTQFPADGHFVIAGSTGNDGAYQIASTSFAGDPAFTIVVTRTIPDDTVDGTIASADAGCKVIALYRGRVVLSGLQTDPHNWFMSAANDPLDWDYDPTTTSQTQAVAGSSTDAGKLGDVITALAPYSDDLMVIGGDHTLWVMRGDPAAGGVIDNISYRTGIAGPDAFTWDPEGNFYFFGAGSLWRMGAGITSLENLSRHKLDSTFGEINYAIYNVRLAWDDIHKGLHIYLTPNSEPSEAPYQYYWDARTEGFWKDQLPAAHGPTAVHLFDADDPNDRALLVGGFDSYIRYVTDDVRDDDSIAIGSYVAYPPIMPWGPLTIGRMSELNVVLSIDSGPALIIVSGGPNAEYVVLESAARYMRTVQPGQNPALRQRVNGAAFMVRIYGRGLANETWAIETITGVFIAGGRLRRRELV